MKSKRTYVDYLEDILDSAIKLNKFTEDMTYQQFERDERHCLFIIGRITVKTLPLPN
jgi:uncharacterized protein with HEPN domain